ncbi:MAG TPA: HlyD family secretion protein [Sphingomonas sp.]|jgi:membrane fusion protein (multidrug efflux system)|uniref:HlyD family secretion protein n=1 Tax=Sphingomonas sp. TaxID=28214 RepID=UPI002ED99559
MSAQDPDDIHRADGSRGAGRLDGADRHAGRPADGDDDDGDEDRDKGPGLLERRPWIRWVLIIALVAGIAMLVIWLIHYQTRGKYVQSTNDAYLQADSVTIAPKVSGYVRRVLVAENQAVGAGDPLVEIDAADYRAKTAQAEAQIAVARAAEQGAAAGITEQQATITRAQADLAAARRTLAFAQAEVDRYGPLAATGAETQQMLAQKRTDRDRALAQVDAQAAAVRVAQAHVATIRGQVAQARAQGAQARAQRAEAESDLSATLLRTSIAGVVGDRTVQVGQYVQAGTRLMSVVPVQALYLAANFKETQLGLMRVGQPATIEVDALPGVDLHGVVESVSPGSGATFSLIPPENASGNFTKIVQRVPVRIRIDAGPMARKILRPGLSVTVSVDTYGARNARKALRDESERRQEARQR